MSYLKATNFDRKEQISSITTDPSKYPQPNLRAKMQAVLNQTSADSGRWYISLCKGVASGDSTDAINNYYPVFYAVTSGGTVLETSSHIVAAPCPPFCSDQSPVASQE